MAAEIATIALDEFKAHHVHWNYTGLIQRYYHLVERDFGGMYCLQKNIRITLNTHIEMLNELETNSSSEVTFDKQKKIGDKLGVCKNRKIIVRRMQKLCF